MLFQWLLLCAGSWGIALPNQRSALTWFFCPLCPVCWEGRDEQGCVPAVPSRQGQRGSYEHLRLVY